MHRARYSCTEYAQVICLIQSSIVCLGLPLVFCPSIFPSITESPLCMQYHISVYYAEPVYKPHSYRNIYASNPIPLFLSDCVCHFCQGSSSPITASTS